MIQYRKTPCIPCSCHGLYLHGDKPCPTEVHCASRLRQFSRLADTAGFCTQPSLNDVSRLAPYTKEICQGHSARMPDKGLACGMAAVTGTRMTETARITFFMFFNMEGSCPCMPSAAPTSTVISSMALHNTGSAYVGSAMVRSLNQSAPPWVRDGTCSTPGYNQVLGCSAKFHISVMRTAVSIDAVRGCSNVPSATSAASAMMRLLQMGRKHAPSDTLDHPNRREAALYLGSSKAAQGPKEADEEGDLHEDAAHALQGVAVVLLPQLGHAHLVLQLGLRVAPLHTQHCQAQLTDYHIWMCNVLALTWTQRVMDSNGHPSNQYCKEC